MLDQQTDRKTDCGLESSTGDGTATVRKIVGEIVALGGAVCLGGERMMCPTRQFFGAFRRS